MWEANTELLRKNPRWRHPPIRGSKARFLSCWPNGRFNGSRLPTPPLSEQLTSLILLIRSQMISFSQASRPSELYLCQCYLKTTTPTRRQKLSSGSSSASRQPSPSPARLTIHSKTLWSQMKFSLIDHACAIRQARHTAQAAFGRLHFTQTKRGLRGIFLPSKTNLSQF